MESRFLHGIGFVVKASDARLTPMQLYVFNSILRIFGKDVKENIFVLMTFCDAEKPVVLSALKEAGIPYHGKEFKFNNSALFAEKDVKKEEDKDDSDEDDDDIDGSCFNSSFFKLGMKSFTKFFKRFEKAEARSLQLTKEVLEERKRLEVLIQDLRGQIVAGIGKIRELQEENKVLNQHKADIEASKDFTYTVTVTYQVGKDTKKRVTNCISCGVTCHFDCACNKDKHNCRVMKNKFCTVCPRKCHHTKHVNQLFYYEPVQEEEERTYEDLKARYDDATSKLTQSELVLRGLNNDIVRVKEDVIAKVKEAHKTLQRLEEIALNPDRLSETDYIELCIKSEKLEAKPGWQERINYFEDLLDQNECITSVKDLPLSNISDTAEFKTDHADQHHKLIKSPSMHDIPKSQTSENLCLLLYQESPNEHTISGPVLEPGT